MAPFSEYCGHRLIEGGFEAFYAFDTARDMMLRRRPHRVNILTDADPASLAHLFADIEFRTGFGESGFLRRDEIGVHFYTGEYPAGRPLRVPGLWEGNGEMLERALHHDPFRTNAFFYSLGDGVFHDPLDSYRTLKRKVIETVDTPSRMIEEFPHLGLLTARVFGDTGFDIDPALVRAIGTDTSPAPYAHPDPSVAALFLDLLTSRRGYESLLLLDQWGILEMILPEVTGLKVVDQDKDHHPEGDAFLHTLHCLRYVKRPNENLMMALLLHDTGKAHAWNRRSEKPFPAHAGESRKIARNVLRRFHFSPTDTQEVLFLVENHMMLSAVDRLPESRRKFLFESPYFSNLLNLYRADIESGYHRTHNYHRALRAYRSFLRKTNERAYY
jgi:tRNA nucleotidyltransferase/poly(A) polymerase